MIQCIGIKNVIVNKKGYMRIMSNVLCRFKLKWYGMHSMFELRLQELWYIEI